MYQSFTQAYFMSLLFMIAGYFTPGSLKRKGVGTFLRDRFIHLGIPTCIFIFIIHPFCVMLSHPEVRIVDYYIDGILSFKFIAWTGPLWFAVLLLIFAVIYVAVTRLPDLFKIRTELNITVKNVSELLLLIAVIAFATRTVFPIGSAVSKMQLSFFSAYVILFVLGILARGTGLMEKVDLDTGKQYMIIAFAVGVPCWLMLMLFGGPAMGIFLINGGLNWQAFAFALWESFFCVTVVLGLVGIFRHRFNTRNSVQKFMSDNAFAVYVFHAPVLIIISVLLKTLVLYPLVKFAMVAVFAILLSFCLAYLIRKIPVMGKIFS